MEDEEITKIVLVGDCGVGKTSFVTRMFHDNFSSEPDSTIGAAVRQFTIDDDKYMFWDTAGQERFRSIIGLYYRSCDCVIIFHDTSKPETLESFSYWLDSIEKKAPCEVPVIVVGTKADIDIKANPLGKTTLEGKNNTIEKLLQRNNIYYVTNISSKSQSSKIFKEEFFPIFQKVRANTTLIKSAHKQKFIKVSKDKNSTSWNYISWLGDYTGINYARKNISCNIL
jgi:small GTP-binding protein